MVAELDHQSGTARWDHPDADAIENLKVERAVDCQHGIGERRPDQPRRSADVGCPSTVAPEVVATAQGGNAAADRNVRPGAHEQRAFAVHFQMIGKEPSELGVERHECDVGLGLPVARDAATPGGSPATDQSAGPIASGERPLLGCRGLRHSRQATEEQKRGVSTAHQLRWCAMTRLRAILVVLALLGGSWSADAHPAPFSFVDISIRNGAVDVTAVVHIWDVAHEYGIEDPNDLLDQGLVDERVSRLGALLNERLALSVDGRPVVLRDWSVPELLAERQAVRVRAQGELDQAPGRLELSAELFPYDPNHQTFLNFYESDLTAQAILGGDDTSYEYFVGSRQGRWAVVQKFVPAGVHHILIGPDHLMFLIGLLLLGGSAKQLLAVVTAFTLAHSITLSLAVLNVVTPPGRLVEPIIALSIVYVGVDNLMSRGGKDVRVWIAMIFGLIHGFGFASVLREMGLPSGALGWSLFSFNLGVEFGQLAVVLAVAVMLSAIRARSAVVGERVVVAGSIAVIAAGAFWFVERVFFSGGVA